MAGKNPGHFLLKSFSALVEQEPDFGFLRRYVFFARAAIRFA
jgi:hypothetical protein